MPHIDELLGSVTIAAAGLVAAIALQPAAGGAPVAPRTAAPVTSTANSPDAVPMVRLAPVDVVARRSVELARIEREEQLACERPLKDAARPEV
jgi:hypothetical protein